MKYIRMSPNVEYSTDREFFLEHQILCIVSREGMGCGRSFHGLAAITKAADVLVDFTHDMQLHPLTDMAA